MIEESIIESARLIKNEFNRLNDILTTYESDVKILADSFFRVSDELTNLDVSQTDSIEKIRDLVLNKLSDLELESNAVTDKIDDINDRMEKLKKEEMDLYKIIKNRYPSMSDDDIKIELQKRIG